MHLSAAGVGAPRLHLRVSEVLRDVLQVRQLLRLVEQFVVLQDREVACRRGAES
jgi:hypothetical protein